MASHAQSERRALAHLMIELGPDAPTLSGEWTTADLAAHLVLRERRPDAAGGIAVPLLSSYTARVQRKVREGRSFEDLVEAVRTGPPLVLRPVDEMVNLVEFFVHHEDVRRAVDGWEPRLLAWDLEAVLWRRLRLLAPLLFRRVRVAAELVAPGLGEARLRPGTAAVTLTGPPGELLLAAYGRLDHARIEVGGDEEAAGKLRSSRLGL